MFRKKILLPFLIFIIFLSAATFIYFFYINKPTPQSTVTVLPAVKTFDLQLTTVPDDGSSTDQNKVSIEGTTGKDSIVVVNGGAEDTSISTTNGKFSLTYTLTEGENKITITAFDQTTGEEKTVSRSVLYSPDLSTL